MDTLFHPAKPPPPPNRIRCLLVHFLHRIDNLNDPQQGAALRDDIVKFSNSPLWDQMTQWLRAKWRAEGVRTAFVADTSGKVHAEYSVVDGEPIRLDGPLELAPIDLQEAGNFIHQHHRHHPKPPKAWKIGVAVRRQGTNLAGRKIPTMVGVAVLSRPKARHSDDGETIEVVRNCVSISRNAATKLYGACAQIARAAGYKRLITFTLLDEDGSSLRAAGFVLDGETEGGSWSRQSRPRLDEQHPTEPKKRWVRSLK